jgi:hypothetical protein
LKSVHNRTSVAFASLLVFGLLAAACGDGPKIIETDRSHDPVDPTRPHAGTYAEPTDPATEDSRSSGFDRPGLDPAEHFVEHRDARAPRSDAGELPVVDAGSPPTDAGDAG